MCFTRSRVVESESRSSTARCPSTTVAFFSDRSRFLLTRLLYLFTVVPFNEVSILGSRLLHANELCLCVAT